MEHKARKSMRRKNWGAVSARQFIKAWQNSESMREVYMKTGMSHSAIGMRANKYRKRDIPLKALGHLEEKARAELSEYAASLVG